MGVFDEMESCSAKAKNCFLWNATGLAEVINLHVKAFIISIPVSFRIPPTTAAKRLAQWSERKSRLI